MVSAPPSLFPGRSLRICYWNTEARLVDAERMNLESHLRRLGELRVDSVKSLDDPALVPCDLLIVAAQVIPVAEFPVWLQGLKKRIQARNLVWTPALILAEPDFAVLSGILPEIARENWYFDVIAPAHLSSLPMRVANLLRMHDHLHELRRYEDALDDVNQKVKVLEEQLASLNRRSKP